MNISGQVQRVITTIKVQKGQRKQQHPQTFKSVIPVAMTISGQAQRVITTIMVQKGQTKYPLTFRSVITVAMSTAATWKSTAVMDGLITSTQSHIKLQNCRLIREISRWKRRKRQIKNRLLTTRKKILLKLVLLPSAIKTEAGFLLMTIEPDKPKSRPRKIQIKRRVKGLNFDRTLSAT